MAVVVTSIFSLGYGINLALSKETGQPIVNWIREDAVILANGVRWTWGVFGSAADLPDSWHFDVTLRATRTVQVRLLWGDNTTILYSKIGSEFAESLEIDLPRTNSDWRMDWQIFNPNPADVRILNFTVAHYSVRYPTRAIGFAISAGSMLALIVSVLLSGVSLRRSTSARS